MSHVSPYELMPPAEELMRRYRELRDYVQLSDEDIQHAIRSWKTIEQLKTDLVDDFYAELNRHPETAAVLSEGGIGQMERLKVSLVHWLEELFAGNYDENFVQNRWIVGWRHVRVGLAQVWTAAAMSRLKNQLLQGLANAWTDGVQEFHWAATSISRMVDLDLTLIQDAYHAEKVADNLQAEKKFNEAIIDTTQAIVVVVDGQSCGKILRGNRYLAQLVGNTDTLSADLDSILKLIPKSDHQRFEELFDCTWPETPCGPAITRLIDSANRQHTIRWFCRNVPNPLEANFRGKNCQLLVGHDISDLIEAQQQAVRHERLAAIGQTMAGLAHESRNAFQRSQAALETLALELGDKSDALLLVERIQRANDHLLHLYQEVLQFAKPARLDVRVCHLDDIARTTCQHLVQAGHCAEERLVVTVADDMVSVVADPFAVEQILRNLIENALAATPEPKRVAISVTPAGDSAGVVARVEVRDQGPGIRAEHIEQIFEPFFSTKPRGTGLGLPIARRLAESHGGSLSLVPSDSGTTAVLELPETPNEQLVPDPESQPDPRRTS